jgi:hypothetical protein
MCGTHNGPRISALRTNETRPPFGGLVPVAHLRTTMTGLLDHYWPADHRQIKAGLQTSD